MLNIISEALSPLPHTIFLTKLLAILPTIAPDHKTCEQFFEFLSEVANSYPISYFEKLVKDACVGVAGGKPSDFASLLDKLVLAIKEHPIIEKRGGVDPDFTLVGLLKLTRRIITSSTEFKLHAGQKYLSFVCFF